MRATRNKVNLFRNNKPVIRPFEPIDNDSAGDMPFIWDAYKRGDMENMPENLSMDAFIDLVDESLSQFQEAWVVEDYNGESLKMVGVVLGKNNGWLLEPHVQYFKSATARNKLRTYVAFLKKTKYRKDIGACLLRVPKDTMNLANRVEKYGIIEYVGKIWNGTPTGNQYLYSVRCKKSAERNKVH